jgi:membrane protein DedA with SNARE-associated domain
MVAKFIPGLDGICPPLAGMMGASHVDFIFYDAVGSALWAGAYITCGFLFATELDRVVRYTSVFANVLVLALGRVLTGGLAAWRALQFPLILESLDPEAEMMRLGIEMFPPWQSTGS